MRTNIFQENLNNINNKKQRNNKNNEYKLNQVEEKKDSLNETLNIDNKNIETLPFIDENKKSEKSSFLEFEILDKEIINNNTFKQISDNLTKSFFKKIPYNEIKSIVQQDNIIYKKNNNIPLENYNKRNRFLGKKTKRKNNENTYCQKDIKNFMNDIYPFKASISSKSDNSFHIKNKNNIYNSPLSFRSNLKKSKSNISNIINNN